METVTGEKKEDTAGVSTTALMLHQSELTGGALAAFQGNSEPSAAQAHAQAMRDYMSTYQ